MGLPPVRGNSFLLFWSNIPVQGEVDVVNKNLYTVYLNKGARSATLDDAVLPLQDKAWQVLAMLIDNAPQVVSRQALIEKIWRGRHFTGEKGLNQALWAIRTALGDEARSPTYIRTISRTGYQWIGVPAAHSRSRLTRAGPRAIASIVLISLSGALSISASNVQTYELPPQCLGATGQQTSATLVNSDVIIDIRGGCRLIVKPSGTKTFGAPLVSSDGKHVAFTVHRSSGCEFVSIALMDGSRTEFDVCPNNTGSGFL